MNEESSSTVRYILDGIYSQVQIHEFSLNHSINEHASLTISGIIPEELVPKCISSGYIDNTIVLIALDEQNNQEIIFQGIITNLEHVYESNFNFVTFFCKSNSYITDVFVNSQSFQNAQYTYDQVIKKTMNQWDKYSGWAYNPVDTKLNDEIESLFIQYNETDWEFLKRVVSHLNIGLIPSLVGSRVLFWAGLPKLETYSWDNVEFKIINNPLIWNKLIENKRITATDNELDFIKYYVFNQFKRYNLGDRIKFKNEEFYIGQMNIDYLVEEGITKYSYTISKYLGWSQPTLFNQKLKGATIRAIVIDRIHAYTKLHLWIDEFQTVEDARWIPHTVYYAGGGKHGWCAMPDLNEIVRLYFPTEHEEESQIIGSEHVDFKHIAQYTNQTVEDGKSEKSPKNAANRDDFIQPETKNIQTGGTGLLIDDVADSNNILFRLSGEYDKGNTDGKATLRIDNNGARFYSRGNINLASENISIFAKNNLTMKATDITWICGASTILQKSNDEIHMKSLDIWLLNELLTKERIDQINKDINDLMSQLNAPDISQEELAKAYDAVKNMLEGMEDNASMNSDEFGALPDKMNINDLIKLRDDLKNKYSDLRIISSSMAASGVATYSDLEIAMAKYEQALKEINDILSNYRTALPEGVDTSNVSAEVLDIAANPADRVYQDNYEIEQELIKIKKEYNKLLADIDNENISKESSDKLKQLINIIRFLEAKKVKIFDYEMIVTAAVEDIISPVMLIFDGIKYFKTKEFRQDWKTINREYLKYENGEMDYWEMRASLFYRKYENPVRYNGSVMLGQIVGSALSYYIQPFINKAIIKGIKFGIEIGVEGISVTFRLINSIPAVNAITSKAATKILPLTITAGMQISMVGMSLGASPVVGQIANVVQTQIDDVASVSSKILNSGLTYNINATTNSIAKATSNFASNAATVTNAIISTPSPINIPLGSIIFNTTSVAVQTFTAMSALINANPSIPQPADYRIWYDEIANIANVFGSSLATAGLPNKPSIKTSSSPQSGATNEQSASQSNANSSAGASASANQSASQGESGINNIPNVENPGYNEQKLSELENQQRNLNVFSIQNTIRQFLDFSYLIGFAGINKNGQLPNLEPWQQGTPMKDVQYVIASDAEQHLINANKPISGKKAVGVVGTHNMEEFFNTLESTGKDIEDMIAIQDVKFDEKFPGLVEVKYKIPIQDRGKYIDQFKYITNPKTLYNPAYYSDKQIYDWGLEAMANGYLEEYIVYGEASNGMKFIGYYRDGVVSNFFPVLSFDGF